MASVKFQLEELKKPNPRIVLELHTIRGMIQEVDNMDKASKAIIHRTQGYQMPPGGVPSAPQPPSAVGNALFAPPVPPTTPPAPAAMSCTPHLPPLLPARRKKPSRSQGTPMPPPIPTAAATSGFTSLSSQTPKSPKESRSGSRQLVAMARKGRTASKRQRLHTLLRPLLRLPNLRMRKAVGRGFVAMTMILPVTLQD